VGGGSGSGSGSDVYERREGARSKVGRGWGKRLCASCFYNAVTPFVPGIQSMPCLSGQLPNPDTSFLPLRFLLCRSLFSVLHCQRNSRRFYSLPSTSTEA
jgi:hypothetical protein